MSRTDVPPALREYIAQRFPPGQVPNQVPTHEIMVPFMADHLQMRMGEALSQLQSTDQGGRFISDMRAQSVKIAGEMVQETVRQRQNALKTHADSNFDLAYAMGDYDKMLEVGRDAVATGAWTPEYGTERIREATFDTSKNAVTLRLNAAQSQIEIDLIEQDIFNEDIPLRPDDRISLAREVRTMRAAIDKEQTRERAIQYSVGQNMLIEGTLTLPWIQEQLRQQTLTGQQAASLRRAFETAEAPSSDPRVLDDLRGRVSMLPYPTGAMREVPLTTRINLLRDEINSEFTGLNELGEFTGRRISGSDYAQLMRDLANAENTALGQGSQDYINALRAIDTYTGYSEKFANAFDADAPNRAAHAAFISELVMYQSMRGPSDPPLYMWVQQNAGRFSPERYRGSYLSRMQARFPRYAPMMADYDFDEKALVEKARNDYENGVIPESKYNSLIHAVEYRFFMELGTRPTASSPYSGAD